MQVEPMAPAPTGGSDRAPTGGWAAAAAGRVEEVLQSRELYQEAKALRLSRSSRSTVAIDQLGAVADVLDKALTILIEKRQLLGGQRAEVNQAVAQLDLELEDRVWEAMELCYQEEKQQLASGGIPVQ